MSPIKDDKVKRIITLFILSIVLASCAPSAQAPVQTPIPADIDRFIQRLTLWNDFIFVLPGTYDISDRIPLVKVPPLEMTCIQIVRLENGALYLPYSGQPFCDCNLKPDAGIEVPAGVAMLKAYRNKGDLQIFSRVFTTPVDTVFYFVSREQ
jgi:hypothetical protein